MASSIGRFWSTRAISKLPWIGQHMFGRSTKGYSQIHFLVTAQMLVDVGDRLQEEFVRGIRTARDDRHY